MCFNDALGGFIAEENLSINAILTGLLTSVPVRMDNLGNERTLSQMRNELLCPVRGKAGPLGAHAIENIFPLMARIWSDQWPPVIHSRTDAGQVFFYNKRTLVDLFNIRH